VEFTNGDVVVLDGPGSLLALPPGETTIPLVEGFVVPDCPEIPNGLYHFTVVPLDPETGLSVADHAQFRLFRSGS
jgi:hypothetical protein